MIPLADIMQQAGLRPSEDPGLLKVTISKFYRPSGQSTQLAGVKSDIVLPSVTDTPEISEASLDNPLPWDTIPAADFTSENRVQPYLAALRDRSAERVAKSPDFTLLREDCEQFRKNRATKSVSLNEAARRTENAAIKSRMEAAEKAFQARKVAQPETYEITLKNVDQPGPGKPVKDSNASSKTALSTHTASPEEDNVDAMPSNDILLRETEHILSDYQELLAHENSAVATRN
jgi:carboxyl-terminal processing protease